MRRLPAAAELARVDSLAVESVTVVTLRARSGEGAGVLTQAGVTYGRLSVATGPYRYAGTHSLSAAPPATHPRMRSSQRAPLSADKTSSPTISSLHPTF